MGEAYPFIEEILASMPSIICDLEPHQIHTFYEAIGHMIAVHDDMNVCPSDMMMWVSRALPAGQDEANRATDERAQHTVARHH